MTDAWLTNAGKKISPHVICRSVQDLFRVNMALLIVDMTRDTPQDWQVRFVHTYSIPTTLFDARKAQQDRQLSSLPEWASLGTEQHVIRPCRMVTASGRPEFGRIDETVYGIRIVCDRLVLPDPSGTGRWCILFYEVQSISGAGQPTRYDDVDLSILQLSREGLSAGEIGMALELSARTIEHRIAKIKARTGVTAFVRLLSATW
ncbi:hypothetical protein [Neorhizobium sp. T25_27]|uniref:hypothetical protein n=1 Tax=Neorhizobium sp. T25_27 TaxID=2093831 RepID=UPI000CFA5EAA|nr:hypothetical protein [Neorhizobium sp. T25_27]